MSMRGVYTQAVKRQLAGYFGNWEPSGPISLGDYGHRVGDAFERVGSLETLGVNWVEQARAPGQTHQKFTSSKAVKVGFQARGAAPGAKASIKIDFGAANAVFADLAGCSYHRIDDKRALGEQLECISRFDRQWVVVTDLVKARRSIIAISTSKSASVTFEAEGNVEALDLANAEGGLKAGFQADIGYLIDAERDLTPIIGLCGFRNRFLAPDQGLRTLRAEIAVGEPAPTEVSDPIFLQLA